MTTREWQGRDRAARLEAAVLAVVLSIGIIGIALLPVTSAWYVRTLVRAVDSAAITGLGPGETERAAEAVRRFVTDSGAPQLPTEIDGRPAFDDAAVWHLVDVRDVLIPARWLSLLLFATACAWLWLRSRHGRRGRFAGSVLRATAGILVTAVVLAVGAGIADFDVLFAWFHSLFFESGTWTFPYDALLTQVFPLPFWVAAGATWGAIVLCGALGSYGLARRLRFT